MRIAWKERLAGCPPAKRAGAGIAWADRLHQLLGAAQGRDLPAPDDRAGDRAGVALLAVVAQDPAPGGARRSRPAGCPRWAPSRGPCACPGVRRRSRRSRARGCRAASRRSRGRTAPRRRSKPSAASCIEGLRVAGADEAHLAADLAAELREAPLRQRVAVDRHQRAGLAQALGDQAGVTAPSEGAVDDARPGWGSSSSIASGRARACVAPAAPPEPSARPGRRSRRGREASRGLDPSARPWRPPGLLISRTGIDTRGDLRHAAQQRRAVLAPGSLVPQLHPLSCADHDDLLLQRGVFGQE